MKKNKIQLIRFLIQSFFMLGIIISLTPGYNSVGKVLFLPILLVGVFFCGWVCPFGAIQDWLFRISKKLKFPSYQPPQKIQKYLQLSRYIFYAFSTIGLTIAVLNARSSFNHKLFSGTLTLTAGFILIFFLIASLFINRPFCNYFCMKGARYGLFSILRIFGIHRNAKTCIHCHLCDKNCPMNIPIESTNFVRHPNCINCLTCVCVCPKNCIKFKMMSKD